MNSWDCNAYGVASVTIENHATSFLSGKEVEVEKKLVIFMSKNALKKKSSCFFFFLLVTKPVLSLSFEVTYISL